MKTCTHCQQECRDSKATYCSFCYAPFEISQSKPEVSTAAVDCHKVSDVSDTETVAVSVPSSKLKIPFILAACVLTYFVLSLVSTRSVSQVSTQSVSSEDSPSVIHWHSYNEGIAKSKAEKKPVYLLFHANWCGYCKKMEQEVFPVESVKQKLQTDFIPIRVIEGSQNKVSYANQIVKEDDLIAAYQVRGFPGHAWISPDGEYLQGLSGFMPVEDFNRYLDFWHQKFK